MIRFNETLKRMLKTPPKPNTSKPATVQNQALQARDDDDPTGSKKGTKETSIAGRWTLSSFE